MSSNDEAMTRGAHHVGLTVSDLEGARRFFESVLGFDTVATYSTGKHEPSFRQNTSSRTVCTWPSLNAA